MSMNFWRHKLRLASAHKTLPRDSATGAVELVIIDQDGNVIGRVSEEPRHSRPVTRKMADRVTKALAAGSTATGAFQSPTVPAPHVIEQTRAERH